MLPEQKSQEMSSKGLYKMRNLPFYRVFLSYVAKREVLLKNCGNYLGKDR
jgi:hypothetical protein